MTRYSSGLRPVFGAAIGLIVAQTPAFAHVTLATGQARTNAPYSGALQVPHGCAGEITQTIRVQIPDGILAVEPMPKPGWTLNVSSGAYAKTYRGAGKAVTEGVKEIVWSGGNLPNDGYDEFTFKAFVSEDLQPGRTIYFPTVQQCAKGEAQWVDVPGEQTAQDLKAPAPSLQIVAENAAIAQAMDHSHGAKPVVKGASAAMPMAGSDTYKVGDLVVTSPWTRATPGGAKIGGGYLKITNNGTNADHLLSVVSDGADHVEIHEMSMSNGIMQMRPLANGLEIKPSETVELKPGGLHMMFMGLKQPLKEGDTLVATLTFEKAGSLSVKFSINAIGATDGSHHN
jgi:uncharacterized protein YcnI/copper(I)-binding protein